MASRLQPGAYQYSPLTSGSDDANKCFTIRLLHLLPSADSEAPLRCHLVETWIPLSEGSDAPPVQYHALSYTWGDPLFPATLEVVERTARDDGPPPDQVGVINITENLHSALQNLRKRGENLVIWVDAVCINQADAVERNSQVTNMPNTYGHASSVIIWLGRDAENRGHEERVVPFLYELATLVNDLERTCYTPQPDEPGEIYYNQLNSWRRRLAINKMVTSFLKDSGLNRLQWFLDRPWFRRRWIIQEVVLAKKVIVHSGSWSLPWDTLVVAMRELSGNIMGPFTEANRTNMHTITTMRQLWTFQGSSHPLGVLVRFAHFECADPRDRLYALYGVMKKQAALSPQIWDIDYTLSTANLYMKFSTMMLHFPGLGASSQGPFGSTLLVLQAASSFRQQSLASKPGTVEYQSMPSWVVDWTGIPRFETLKPPQLHHSMVWLHATSVWPRESHAIYGTISPCLAFRRLLNTIVLFLQGVIVDVVTAIIPVNIEPLLDTGNIYRAKQEFNDFLCQFAHQVRSATFQSRDDGNVYHQGDFLMELGGRDHLVTAIAVSLVADWSHTPPNSYFGQDLQYREAFKEQLRKSDYHLPDILHKWPAYVELVALTMRGRSLIMTAGGYIGIAASDTGVGDLVCLPESSTVPFVLRPQGRPAELIDDAVKLPNLVRCRESSPDPLLHFERNPTAHTTFQLVSDAYIHGLFKDLPPRPALRGRVPAQAITPIKTCVREVERGDIVLLPII